MGSCYTVGYGFGIVFEIAECVSGQAGCASRNYFRFVYWHCYSYGIRPSGPNLALTDVGAVTTSAVNSISGRETTSGRDSGSSFSAELRLSRTCDRSTMELVISVRLTSAERVTIWASALALGAPVRKPTRKWAECDVGIHFYFRSAKPSVNRTLSVNYLNNELHEISLPFSQNGSPNRYLREIVQYDSLTTIKK